MDILYIDDYINLYSKRLNKIITYKPYKKTTYKGKIVDKNKFIKIYKKLKIDNKLISNLFKDNIIIIINNTYTTEDKILLKDIFEELNYKNTYFIQEVYLLNINNDSLYIECNYNYINILFNNKNKTIIRSYEWDNITKNIIINIIKIINKDNIYIFGKNVLELESIINNTIDYYIFSNYDTLLIRLLLDM